MAREPSNGALRFLVLLTKGGAWALVVFLVVLQAGEQYGFLQGQSRRAAEGVETHASATQAQARTQQESLDRILTVLEEQRRIQAQAALIACFKEAKQDSDRAECIKKFPIK